MNVYLDTSVVLRRLLCQPGEIKGWGSWDKVYASTLVKVETLRAMDRLRLEGVLTDKTRSETVVQINEMSEVIHWIPVGVEILERASQPFPTVIGTLDAIHLSTALALRDRKRISVAFLTHDVQLGIAAQSLGFTVEGMG